MSHTETVKKLYAAFQQGDVATILESCDENVDWNNQQWSTKDLPWNGNFSGRKNLPGFFQGLAESADFDLFNPSLFVEQGKNVAVLLRIAGKLKKNGKGFEHDSVHFW